MAIYKIFPTKDSTIYSRYPSRNTGLDSIIEASVDTDAKLSRYLIQFSQTEVNTLVDGIISSSYASGSGFEDIKVNLKNFIADIKNLNTDTTSSVSYIWILEYGNW